MKRISSFRRWIQFDDVLKTFVQPETEESSVVDRAARLLSHVTIMPILGEVDFDEQP